ncbi:MAG: Calx-beta domain-containing protein [Kineosporiaceae bacterium]
MTSRSRSTRRLGTALVTSTALLVPLAGVLPAHAAPAGAARAAARAEVPAAPTNIVAVAGDASATLTWTPPPGDFKRLRITDVTTKRVMVVTPGDDGMMPTTAVFKGLTNGVVASFVLVAFNNAGRGEESEPTAPVVPQAVLRIEDVLREGLAPNKALITVRYAGGVTQVPLSFRLRTTDAGTAKPGTDFQPVDVTVTIPAKKSKVTVPITLVDDAVGEPEETVGFELTSDVAVLDPTRTLRISDDDTTPALYVGGAASVQEGDSGVTPMTFTLRLSQAATEPVVVRLATETRYRDGQWYQAASNLKELDRTVQKVTIPAGTVSVPVTVGVIADRRGELPMVVTLHASVLSGPATVAVDRNDGEVVDDDEFDAAVEPLTVDAARVGTWDPADAGGAVVTLTNRTFVPVSGATVVVQIAAPVPLSRLRAAVTRDPSCALSLQDEVGSKTSGFVATLQWTCKPAEVVAGTPRQLTFTAARALPTASWLTVEAAARP